MQDYNAITDLEYFLIEGNHRSKVSFAIKKYINYINNHKFFYNKFFNGKFEKVSKNYINSLIDANFKKAVMEYEIENKMLKFLLFKISPKLQRIFYLVNNT